MRKADGKKGIRLWINDTAGLQGLVQLGVVEVHPWAATVGDIERPDQLIFDLDAGPGIGWELVVKTAFALRDLLAQEGFHCWPKLTGGSGVHLMAEVEPTLTHAEMHRYAKSLAEKVARREPTRYTTLAGASQRIGKLFIDCFRNGRGATAIGAYSPRARPGLPIAIPTTWREIERGVRPDEFTLGALRR